MKTGIIIPCYNEATRLNQEAFVNFAKSHADYHVCFVNDGSADHTLEVLESVAAQSPENISVVDVKINAGKAAAVRTGVKVLSQDDSIEFIGFIDADLSTDFEDFKSLVTTLKKNDDLTFVYGSRGKGEGEIKRNFFRNVFSKIVKSIVFLILGLPIEDTQCGAKVFRKEIIGVAYAEKFLTRWLFDVEIFIRLKKFYGSSEVMHKMHEQPLTRWVHMDDSKLGMKDAIQIPYKLLSIWVAYSILKPTTSVVFSAN
ncbi:glycosyltransferase [Ochrovirga pacifica]|uniref:glycosyltransferase n=1 Tax=Ochrovirga pacifica TaxID=1042376 RepID=UPI0002559D9C|nr:glycosyltransferase [Ochrovirga pacifica]